MNKNKKRNKKVFNESVRVKRKPVKRVKVEKVEDDVDERVSEENENDAVFSENEENFSKVENSSSGENENSENEMSDSDREIDKNGKNESDDSQSEEESKPSKSSKKRRKRKYNPAEEARLERLVFGDPSDIIDNLPSGAELKEKKDDKPLKCTKISLNDSDDSDIPIDMRSDSDDENFPTSETKDEVAWIDENDIQYPIQKALKEQHRRLPSGRPEKTYTELLENKFTKLVGTPKWASLDPKQETNDEDAELDEEILKRSNHLIVPKGKKLRKGKIEIKALTDINKATHIEGPMVTSVEFHPTSTVAMVAGLSGVLSLFQVNGKENPKLQSIRFDKFQINRARFVKDGNEIILGSRDFAYSHTYDLMSGKTYKAPLPHGVTNMKNFEVSPDGKLIAIAGRMGQIHLLSSATKERLADFKMNKKCLSLAFSPDSNTLITHGDSDQMYFWDLKTRRCIHKPNDDGCIANSALAFSPSGQFLATGSKQGVVNVYETETVMRNANPTPLKIVLNLVTPITSLRFNPTSEILAMASNFKENAFRMLHIPSFTVFANFPTFQTKMHNPVDLNFSPGSGYLGLSNNKGHAYLYRLKHYGSY